MNKKMLEALEKPSNLLGSDEATVQPQHDTMRKEGAGEIDELRRVWEAVSDYQIAKRHPEFAEENGGVEKLKQQLVQAVNAYEGNLDNDAK